MEKLVLVACVLLCGCFRGLGDVQPEPADTPSAQLEVYDSSGAVWDGSQSPRLPKMRLRFTSAQRGSAAQHLYLLRGAASDELIGDLRSAKHQAATTARLIALQSEMAAQGVTVEAQPTTPLQAGSAYTLVWVEPGGALTFPIVVSSSPAAGAELRQSLPAALEAAVPINLQRVLLRFDGYVLGDVASAVQLVGSSDRMVATDVGSAPCAELGLGAGDCVWLEPLDLLAAAERYRVVIATGLHDATGAAIAPRELAFTTAKERDDKAPRWQPLDCTKDETRVGALCVLTSDTRASIRARADENGLLELAHPPSLTAAFSAAGDFTLEGDLTTAGPALLVLRDLAGNRAELALDLAPARDLATLTIDEVRADPLGPEPAQEYVELLNYGSQPVALMGFTLTTDPYRDGLRISSEVVVAPLERVVLVSPDFDVQERSDGEPPVGARIVRLPASMALKNDGAALYLRDASGRRVSAAPALAPNRAGQCIVRSSADRRTGQLDAFAQAPCTPGARSESAP